MEQAACATGGHDDMRGGDGVRGTGMGVVGHDAGHTAAGLIEHEVAHIPFLGELHPVCRTLLPEGVQDLVADAVRGVGGPLDRFLAEFPGVATETALGDEPVLGA